MMKVRYLDHPYSRVDDQQGASAEMSAFLPSFFMWIPRIIQIWDGRQKVAVEI